MEENLKENDKNFSNLHNVYEEEIFDVIKQLEEITTSSSYYLNTISNDFSIINHLLKKLRIIYQI